MSIVTSGLFDKMMQMYEGHRLKQVMASFCLADRDERKARLRAVMALSVELATIREIDRFSTGLAEGVISDIIEGDWDAAASLGRTFDFGIEESQLRERYVPLWANFRRIVIEECMAARARKNSDGAPPS